MAAVFVVGAARSGTTLLRLMLDAHPRLAIPHETAFVPRALALGDGAGHEGPRPLPARVPDVARHGDLGGGAARRARRVEPFAVADALRAFYRRYAAARGKERWGDKTPLYALHLPVIAAAFPEARFVHLIRDGRDVAVSLRPLCSRPART